jgi:GntR family transcriptional regulator, transcriptional repressor for pyruvate dehydrogenase complex
VISTMSNSDSVLNAISAQLLRSAGAERRLPTERELSQTLEIGRPAVREQLQALEVVGLVKRDRRRGTFIQAPDGDALGHILDLALMTNDVTADDMQVVRAALEREACRLAAARRDPERDAELREYCRRLRTAKTVKEAVKADLAFHRLIMATCGNRALAFFGSMLSAALERSLIDRRSLLTSRRVQLSVNETHDHVADALEKLDPEAAMHAISHHFVAFDQSVRKVQGASKSASAG